MQLNKILNHEYWVYFDDFLVTKIDKKFYIINKIQYDKLVENHAKYNGCYKSENGYAIYVDGEYKCLYNTLHSPEIREPIEILWNKKTEEYGIS